MKELLLQEISAILTDDERRYLVFILQIFSNPEYLIYEAEGDCCSTSWFESISNPEYLIGALGNQILGVEYKNEVELGDHDKQRDDLENCISVYGYTLKTQHGYSDIEFRNESNGYYGGYCEYRPELKIEFAIDHVSLKRDNKEIAQLKEWKNKE